jgi:hypothetical protein
MAYQAGDLILDDHYNIFATGNAAGTPTAGANVNHIWGVGNGDTGYGQATTVTPVTAGTQVTATQWATLLSRISSMATHQGSTITPITNPTAGNTIVAYNALNTNINTINTNRLNNAAFGTTITPTPATSNGNWSEQTLHTLTCTFSSADAARYFFNGGGEIRISFNIAGGTADGKYNEWVDLTNTLAGTLVFRAQGSSKSGGTGTPSILASTIGYYDLTTSFQTIYQMFADSSPYTSNYVQVRARYSGSLGSNGDRSPQIQFEVLYRDDAADEVFDKAEYTPLDIMDGTVTTNLAFLPPSSAQLTNVWGTPTMGFTQSQT